MKTNRIGFIAQMVFCAVMLSVTPGCALFQKGATEADKAAQIQSLAYGAASFGTQYAIASNPGYRPAFELAFTQLDALVTQKTVTGALLRNILASLPVKELKNDKARIAIEGATYLFDVTVGNKLDIEAQPYILAAATGIRDGIKVGLGK